MASRLSTREGEVPLVEGGPVLPEALAPDKPHCLMGTESSSAPSEVPERNVCLRCRDGWERNVQISHRHANQTQPQSQPQSQRGGSCPPTPASKSHKVLIKV